MVTAQTNTADVSRDETARMKESLRRLASVAGQSVTEEIESFIDGLEETIASKDDRINELQAEVDEMVPLDEALEREWDEEDFVRRLACVHRMLKRGDLSGATLELEHALDRNSDKWRMYVS